MSFDRLRARLRYGPGLVAVVAWGCVGDGTSPEPSPDLVLEELVPGIAYADWFELHTGIVPDAAGLGVYRLEAVGQEVFVGLGATFPNNGDGSLLAAVDATTLRAVAALDEQGFADMTTAGDALLVPGVDPCCGDDWSLGNFYVYREADGLVKRRTLPNVIHGLGVWHDPSTDATYVSTGSHLGDQTTFTGAIWRSSDRGLSWSLVADRSNGVGDVRTYDVFGIEGRMYAVRSDSFSVRGCQLVNRRPGDLWDPLTGAFRTACWPRITGFGDLTLVQEISRTAIQAVDGGDTVTPYDLPFRFPERGIQWGVEVGGAFYCLTDEGSVVRSRDLQSWETVATSDHSLIAIEYWAERDWLVVGGVGTSTGLWKIDLTPSPPS